LAADGAVVVVGCGLLLLVDFCLARGFFGAGADVFGFANATHSTLISLSSPNSPIYTKNDDNESSRTAATSKQQRQPNAGRPLQPRCVPHPTHLR
jgi:hypothetical protein